MIISSFIVISSGTKLLCRYIDSTGFKITYTSQYFILNEQDLEENMWNYLLEPMYYYDKSCIQCNPSWIWTCGDMEDTWKIQKKQIERGYFKLLYNRRNKDEALISGMKRLFGEHLLYRLIRTQNRELSFRT
jgi:hypothetical protein